MLRSSIAFVIAFLLVFGLSAQTTVAGGADQYGFPPEFPPGP